VRQRNPSRAREKLHPFPVSARIDTQPIGSPKHARMSARRRSRRIAERSVRKFSFEPASNSFADPELSIAMNARATVA
jgi:hypothetical protein